MGIAKAEPVHLRTAASAVSGKSTRASSAETSLHLSLQFDRLHLDINSPIVFTANAISSNSDSKITNYFWKFDKRGQFKEGQSKISRIFVTRGHHQVTVIVKDDKGQEATQTERFFVEDPSLPPTVEIKPIAPELIAGSTSGFDLKVRALKRPPVKITWNFGDNESAKMTDLKTRMDHVYKEAGTYTLSVQFDFARAPSFTAKKTISVKPSIPKHNLLTAPNQVLIWGSRSYLELLPGQSRDLSFIAYDVSGNQISYSSVSWNSTNPSVANLTNISSNLATLVGTTSGSTTITVTVDGTISQSITVVVVPFDSNQMAVAVEGNYIDHPGSVLAAAYNNTSGTIYDFVSSYTSVTDVPATAFNVSGTYASDYVYYELPMTKSSVTVAAKQSSNTFTTTKNGLSRFAGRNSFLYFPDAGTNSVAINYSDGRFLDYSQDFSITFWLSANQHQAVALQSNGQYATSITDQNISVTSNAGTQILQFPYKAESVWAHIALTYSTASRILTGYYDGYPIGTITIPNSPLTQPTPTMSIQKLGVAAARVDELRFWNSALTSNQVSSELFNPVQLPSTSILASFGFDTNTMPVETDDNGGAWTININSVAAPGSDANVILAAEATILDSQISNTQSYTLSALPPGGDGYLSGYLDVNLDSNSASSYSYELIVSSTECDSPCAVGTDPIRRVRLSPFIRLSPIGAISPIDQSPIDVKIPFDSHSSQIADRNSIMLAKEVLLSDGTYYISLFQPTEVNMEQGYVRAFLDPQGTYFVTLPDYLPAVRVGYNDPNLAPVFLGSGGLRWYFLSTGFATQYSLNITSGLPASAAISCDSPVFGTFNNTSISFGGLPSTGSTCAVTYTYNLNGFSTSLTDMIVFQSSM